MGLAVTLLAGAVLQEAGVSVRLEERIGWVDGRLRFDEAPARGDSVDVRSDLGLDRPFLTTALSAGGRLGGLTLEAEFSQGRAKGSATPGSSFRWNESLFPAGEELDVQLLRTSLLLEARFCMAAPGDFRFEAGLRLAYDRRVLTIHSPSLGRDGDTLSSFSPEPLVGAAWRFDPRWSLEADLSGFLFAVEDFSSRMLRGSVGLTWSWTDTWALSAGLRGETGRIVSTDRIQRNEAALSQADLFLGIEARF